MLGGNIHEAGKLASEKKKQPVKDVGGINYLNLMLVPRDLMNSDHQTRKLCFFHERKIRFCMHKNSET